MHKKIIIVGILLCTLSTFAFAENKKLTRPDYVNQLNKYIKEIGIKIDEIYKTYEAKVAANKEIIKKLENEKEQITAQLRQCYQKEQDSDINSLMNGPCGHLYGKTTYFKTSSGLVVADDTYALNKCLEKQPTSSKRKTSPCKTLEDKRKKIQQDIENYNYQITTFKNDRDTELNKIELDAKNKSSELTNACKQAYPKKQLFGYCDDLEIQTFLFCIVSLKFVH